MTIAPWQPGTVYALGAQVYAVPPNGNYYQATSVAGTGTSGSSPPAFPTASGGTVTDNPGADQIVWTNEGVAPVDYGQFRISNATFPLALPGSGTAAPSLLSIADPEVYYSLDFFTFVIENYCGAALLQALSNAGVTGPSGAPITGAVMQSYPYDPKPEYLEDQVAFPALFLFRTTSRTEQWTASWEHDVTNFTLIYALPPLDAKGSELVLPILPAVAKALRKKLTDAWDPAYAPPGGSLGDQFDSAPYANLQEVGFGEWGNPKRPLSEWYKIGALPGAGELWFPALVMSGYFVERDMYAPTAGGPSKFAGGDITGNVLAEDGTKVSPFVQVSTQQAPTVASLSVTTGTAAGGTSTTITGTLFLSGPPLVYFGPSTDPQYAASVTYNSPTSLTVTTPAVSGAGTVDVTVVNRDGQSGTLKAAFTFT